MINNILNDFDRLIGKKESLWSDYNLDILSDLLFKFSKDDWAVLKEMVLSYPQYWQERCAEAIGYMDNENGVDVLVLFLDSPYISVSAIAVSELDNMSISLPKIFENRLRRIMEYLKKNAVHGLMMRKK